MICCLKQTHFNCNDIDRLEIKRWKKLDHEDLVAKSLGGYINIR